MPSPQKIDVSVIIPVYNEVDNVELLYREIVEALSKRAFYL